MNEKQVVKEIARYLDDQGYQFFVDSLMYESAFVDDLQTNFANCGLNGTIRIGRRIPDIIGFKPDEEIFAIEVKGDSDLRKGIGQAAHYRRGVHKSYLAASKNELDEFRQTALSCGIGVFDVTNQGVESLTEPNENVATAQINKTRRALAIKTSSFVSETNAFGSITPPVNAFLPIIYLKSKGDLQGTADEVEFKKWSDGYENGLNRNSASHALTLAKTLQLVERADKHKKYYVTDLGLAGYYLLRGKAADQPSGSLGLDSIDKKADPVDQPLRYLSELKSGRSKTYEDAPDIAAFLRERYLSVPDVRLLVQVLASHGGERADLDEILAEVAVEAPDAFLNLFVERQTDYEKRFEKVMKESDGAISEEFKENLMEILSPDYLYNFIHQIIHVGILLKGTDAVHQSKTPEVGEFVWVWDSDTVGKMTHSGI